MQEIARNGTEALRWTPDAQVVVAPEACPDCQGSTYVPAGPRDPGLVVKCPTCSGTGLQKEIA